MLKYFLYSLVVFIISSSTYGSDTIILNDSTEDFVLASQYYEIFEDSQRALTIQDVSAAKFSPKFKVSADDYNYVENPASAYWIRFNVKDISKEKRKWVFELLSLHTQNLQFYIPNAQGEFVVKKAGQNFPFFQREYGVTNFVFDIPYDLQEKIFYVRIESKHAVGFEFKIRSQNYFTHYTVTEYYFLGFYYGILFIMAIYNFLLFFSSKEKVYIYYMLYVLSCMLSSFTEDGLGFQFVWPNFPEWNWHINNYIWSTFFLISFVSYSSAFLELKKNSRKFHIGIIFLTCLYLVPTTVELFFPHMWNFSLLYVLPFIAVYVAAVYVYRRGFTPGRFFILGYTFVFISIIILQLRNHNYIEHNIFTVYSFNYGIVLQVVVLSFALGDRIKIMKAEKDMAQRILIRQLEENQTLQKKVNRELEEKVNSRTQQLVQKSNELSDANVKLQKMTEELNKFASKLDHDNWELNKKVIEETKARMISKELSYEEFTKIFTSRRTVESHRKKLIEKTSAKNTATLIKYAVQNGLLK